MKYIKGETLYYYNKPSCIKLKVNSDYDGPFGSLTIEKFIYKARLAGFESAIKEGKDISANELQGVGVSGPEKYLFKDEHALISKILG
jgi:hypothetical protein